MTFPSSVAAGPPITPWFPIFPCLSVQEVFYITACWSSDKWLPLKLIIFRKRHLPVDDTAPWCRECAHLNLKRYVTTEVELTTFANDVPDPYFEQLLDWIEAFCCKRTKMILHGVVTGTSRTDADHVRCSYVDSGRCGRLHCVKGLQGTKAKQK
uniref:Uncharacterized protein n=1 Tax=Ditylenchus dipsaci TaxID=166011 RepID=A0A915E2X9_9BILA